MPTTTDRLTTRRRGAELEHALYQATLAELVAVGYGRLTMEGVAARARTGKAALYRRWPTKHALVLAALTHGVPPLPELNTKRSARENLLAVLTAITDTMIGKDGFPGIALLGELTYEPELRRTVVDTFVAPRLRSIDSILRHAEHTGEIHSDRLTPLTARIGPALIMQSFLLTGQPPSQLDLALIVDTMLGPRPSE